MIKHLVILEVSDYHHHSGHLSMLTVFCQTYFCSSKVYLGYCSSDGYMGPPDGKYSNAHINWANTLAIITLLKLDNLIQRAIFGNLSTLIIYLMLSLEYS